MQIYEYMANLWASAKYLGDFPADAERRDGSEGTAPSSARLSVSRSTGSLKKVRKTRWTEGLATLKRKHRWYRIRYSVCDSGMWKLKNLDVDIKNLFEKASHDIYGIDARFSLAAGLSSNKCDLPDSQIGATEVHRAMGLRC